MAPQWHRTARLVMPAGFMGFGFFLFLFSCIYCFGVLGFQTTSFMDLLKGCRDHPQVFPCPSVNKETAGGVIGLLFGLVQIGIGAAMFITKEKSELYKIWAVVNSILLTFILSAAILPLHVYSCFEGCGAGYGSGYGSGRSGGPQNSGKQYPARDKAECSPQATYGSDGKPLCFKHWSCNQLSISDGNGIILCYGILGILDSIFIFASVVVMAVMHQAAADSPGGYYPPGSAIQSTASNPSQAGSMAQMPQSQAPTPKMSRMTKH